jgi:hypothetical protein
MSNSYIYFDNKQQHIDLRLLGKTDYMQSLFLKKYI